MYVNPGDELRERLLDRTRRDADSMRRAHADGDRESVRRLGHRLVGAAGALGLETLSRIGGELEQAAREGADRRLATMLDMLEAELGRASLGSSGG